jgi:hypothetical protein
LLYRAGLAVDGDEIIQELNLPLEKALLLSAGWLQIL